MLLLTATFLKVLDQTVKLIVTAIIIRHPELSDKKVQAITSMFMH